VPERLSPADAVARLEASDTLGIPLRTGQPPRFIEALAGRDDWVDLRIYGALLLVWSDAFKHPHVHFLSGFFGPVERALREAGANLSFSDGDTLQTGIGTIPSAIVERLAEADGGDYGVHLRDRRRARLADRALVRRRRGDHHPAPPG
jgi:acyl-CoA hydrolase